MERTVQEVTPSELCDAIDPCEVTLVLGAPSVGKSYHLRRLGPSVERLAETTAIDADELVIVDDFVSAVLHPGDDDRENMNALFARPRGAVLVTRPRSLDWLCRRGHLASAAFLERVDSVLVVRIPPSDYGKSFHEIREASSRQNTFDPEYEENLTLVERVTYPRYDFEDEPLQERIGTVEATVTPAAFLSLSQYGSETVLVGPDIRQWSASVTARSSHSARRRSTSSHPWIRMPRGSVLTQLQCPQRSPPHSFSSRVRW